jgi:hypothetical protein
MNCIKESTEFRWPFLATTYERDFDSKFEEDVHQVIFNRNIPECKGVPCHLWMTKCVSLHNDNGVAMVEGIYHSVSPYLIIETT